MAEAAGSGGGGRSVAKILGIVAVLVSIAAGAVGLLLTLNPGLKPCDGGATAHFTDARVFQHTTYPQYENDRRLNHDPARGHDVGVEVRYGVQMENLRHKEVRLRYSLFRVRANGDNGASDPSQTRRYQEPFTPTTCSRVEGDDVFVTLPRRGHHRYRVVFELYRGADLDQRLALRETTVFTA